ncbi:MAG: hypothetical protein PUH18_05300, partial [Coriobacteriaceae bacterium]|nr:hypothetical protein [Coriobacteriaceae bacterium]
QEIVGGTMAKTMKFKYGKTYDFTDSSTVLDCVAVVQTFAELDAIRAEFTEENVKGATFDGVAIGHIVPLCVTAATDGDNITAHFTSRMKNLDEINAEQISELQEAVANIVEGA